MLVKYSERTLRGMGWVRWSASHMAEDNQYKSLTDSERDAIDRLGQPVVAELARICDIVALKQRIGSPGPARVRAWLDDVMPKVEELKPSKPTITRILRGDTSSYAWVNWVITILNMQFGGITRHKIVEVGSRHNNFHLDDNLQFCATFPRLHSIMANIGIDDYALQGKAFVTRQEEIELLGNSITLTDTPKVVRIEYIRPMRLGLPVRRDKIIAVIRTLNTTYDQQLHDDREIVD